MEILICKCTGKEFQDIANRSGVITEHLKDLNIDVPSSYIRRKYLSENKIFWHLQFFNISKRNEKVHCTIYTEKITAQLKLDLEKHNAQYSPIEIRILKNVHDRFLILDEEELYHLGASFKDLGKRWFAF